MEELLNIGAMLDNAITQELEVTPAESTPIDPKNQTWRLENLPILSKYIISSKIIETNNIAIQQINWQSKNKNYYEYLNKKQVKRNLDETATTAKGFKMQASILITQACLMNGWNSISEVTKAIGNTKNNREEILIIKEAVNKAKAIKDRNNKALESNNHSLEEIRELDLEEAGIIKQNEETKDIAFYRTITNRRETLLKEKKIEETTATAISNLIKASAKITGLNIEQASKIIEDSSQNIKTLTEANQKKYENVIEKVTEQTKEIYHDNQDSLLNNQIIQTHDIQELIEAQKQNPYIKLLNNNLNKNNMGLAFLNGKKADTAKIKLVQTISSGATNGIELAQNSWEIYKLLLEQKSNLTKKDKTLDTDQIKITKAIIEGKTPETKQEKEIAELLTAINTDIDKLNNIIFEPNNTLAKKSMGPNTELKLRVHKVKSLLNLDSCISSAFDPSGANDNSYNILTQEVKGMLKHTGEEGTTYNEEAKNKETNPVKAIQISCNRIKTLLNTVNPKDTYAINAVDEFTKLINKTKDVLIITENTPNLIKDQIIEQELTITKENLAKELSGLTDSETNLQQIENTFVHNLLCTEDKNTRETLVDHYTQWNKSIGDKDKLFQEYFSAEVEKPEQNKKNKPTYTKYHQIKSNSEQVSNMIENRINNLKGIVGHLTSLTKEPIALLNCINKNSKQKTTLNVARNELYKEKAKQKAIEEKIEKITEIKIKKPEEIINTLKEIIPDQQVILDQLHGNHLKDILTRICNDLERKAIKTNKSIQQKEEKVTFLSKFDTDQKQKTPTAEFSSIGGAFHDALKSLELSGKSAFPEHQDPSIKKETKVDVLTLMEIGIEQQKEQEKLKIIASDVNVLRNITGGETIKATGIELNSLSEINKLVKEVNTIAIVSACAAIKNNEDITKLNTELQESIINKKKTIIKQKEKNLEL